MNKESVVLDYLLCALDNKGKLPAFSTEREMCFYASCLMELIQKQAIQLENSRLRVQEELSEVPAYLLPMLDLLRKSKPKKVQDLAGDLAFSLNGNVRKVLMKACLEEMEQRQLLISVTQKGLLKESRVQVCKPEETDRIIQRLRAEFLEAGAISEEAMLLGSLLDNARVLKHYFSAYESDMLKKRLKELRKSPENRLITEMLESVETLIAVIAATA